MASIAAQIILFIFASLIFINLSTLLHEAGHYLAAKRFGVHVIAFNNGIGPTLFKKEHNGTLFTQKLFPLGGSCEIDDKGMNELPLFQRIVVYGIGCLLNISFALVAFFAANLAITGNFLKAVERGLNLFSNSINSIGVLAHNLVSGTATGPAEGTEQLFNVVVDQAAGDPAKIIIISLIVAGVISIFTAFFNALPIPALDGGQILLQIIKEISIKLNRPISDKAILALNQISYGVIMVFIGGFLLFGSHI